MEGGGGGCTIDIKLFVIQGSKLSSQKLYHEGIISGLVY